MKSIVILLAFIDSVIMQDSNKIISIQFGNFDGCDGRDATNYTYIAQYSQDSTCSLESIESLSGTVYLITWNKNGQNEVNELKILAASLYPAGAYYQYEVVHLAQSGNLEGKYVYLKEIGLRDAYLKKCSSVLGYSYVSTKSQVLLIAEELKLIVFTNPTGAFEPFKKSATTICHGKTIDV